MSIVPAMQRRQFLKLAGSAAIAATPAQVVLTKKNILIVIDPADEVASSPAVTWAIRYLRRAIEESGASSTVLHSVPRAKRLGMLLFVTGPNAKTPEGFTKPRPFSKPESLRIVPGPKGEETLWVSGADARGLGYAVLELADRVQCSVGDSPGLHFAEALEESPANEVRSAARAFCSEVEDKRWFYDKTFWTGYLDTLALNRFNRFNLAFGFGYDFPKGVTDDYFHFPYPYLVNVPGYDVRVVPLGAGSVSAIWRSSASSLRRQRRAESSFSLAYGHTHTRGPTAPTLLTTLRG